MQRISVWNCVGEHITIGNDVTLAKYLTQDELQTIEFILIKPSVAKV
jgi:hypothetical protein